MRSRSISIVGCFAGFLALSQLKAQIPAQSAEAAAAVLQQGSVPRLIRFSGTLAAADVKPGGLVGVEFAIYKEESGGVALWSEIQNVEADSSGHFTVLLGSTKNGGLPPDVLGIGEPRWLSVTPVGGVAQPRALLVSVPYALRAEEALRIAGAPAGDLVRKGDLTDSVREALQTIQSDVAPGHPTPQATSGPTTFSGSTTNQIVLVQQTSTGKGIVVSAPSAIGTVSTGGTVGVYGGASGATGIGVEGVASDKTSGASIGVYGTSASPAGTGISGKATSATGSTFGVLGSTASVAGVGVEGTATSGTGSTAGVLGKSASTTGVGVQGVTTDPSVGGTGTAVSGVSASGMGTGVSGTGSAFGVIGTARNGVPNGALIPPAGVYGVETAPTGQVFGVSGVVTQSDGNGSAAVNGSENSLTGQVYGVNGSALSPSNGSAGVNGTESAIVGQVFGVSGTVQSPNGIGVLGNNNAASGPTIGVLGASSSPNGYGTQGASPNIALAGFNQSCTSDGCTPAAGVAGQFYTGVGGTLIEGLSGPSYSSLTPVFVVDGTGKGTFNGGVSSTINNPNGNAIVATNNSTSGSAAALVGISYSSSAAGIAGYDYSTSGGGGLYGESHSASAAAVYGANMGGGLGGSFSGGVFVSGDLNVTGTITGSTKNFKIDDPLDPARKYLYHASIESSEMANIYSGNVTLDRRGEAVVDLPEWFEALNGDFRYQLTTIGRAAPVFIAREIENHRFKIAGGRAGLKVSWQVTGVRHDAWAQAHPLQVEEDKVQH